MLFWQRARVRTPLTEKNSTSYNLDPTLIYSQTNNRIKYINKTQHITQDLARWTLYYSLRLKKNILNSYIDSIIKFIFSFLLKNNVAFFVLQKNDKSIQHIIICSIKLKQSYDEKIKI